MRYENGVPGEIGDLNVEPSLNNPYSGDVDRQTMIMHIRALSAFVAQLNQRLEELEKGSRRS